MIAYIEGAKSCFAPIKHSLGTSLRLNCYMFFQKDQACMWICTSTWVALSNICVTTVNMRIVFYYKISEYAHCSQQVWLLSTDRMSVVWAADDKLFIRRMKCLTEGRLELLIIMAYLFWELDCVTHISQPCSW